MAAKSLLNLDAMIPREDLETREEGATSSSGEGGIPVTELAVGKLHYGLLRKPDFQRETNDWSIDNVVTLIKSFRDADLIPALIMWRSQAGYSFVIDGAHRLSALIAWVNDDFGDKAISRKFFDDKIPRQQEKNASECRDRVAAEVGTYSDLSKALTDDNPTRERIRWASNISKSLMTQWVGGDAATAEKSFITINQRSVQIDATEQYMIEARRKPNVIATRALVRSATGHQYWSKFDSATQGIVRARAKSIYDILFEPENAELLRTIEMPVAGKAYSADALRITMELVNFTNDLRTKNSLEELSNDIDGSKTVRFLERTLGVVKYISGDGNASLGLHPAVYFWGATGKHQPAAFLAVVSFIQYLLSSKLLISFCLHRANFEEFLINRQPIIKHILSKFGGWKKSSPSVMEMYKIVLDGFREGETEDEIQERLLENPRFSGLIDLIQSSGYPNKKISKETKIAVRRRELLSSAIRCSVCYARLPSSAFSDDHVQRVQDGGRGTEGNVQLTHPYCNHGFKEYLVSSGKPFPKNPFGQG